MLGLLVMENIVIKTAHKHFLAAALVVASSLGIANSAYAGVALGATRVVYPANQKQVSLGISNNDDKSTFLIQSWVENAAGAKDNRFVITPPLFVIKGKRENSLRIIDGTEHSLPQDRETLFWVNVKAIPSMNKSQQSQNTLQLAIISRIKMFYRPNGLRIAPEEAAKQLRFKKSGTALTLVNPTPYYLTVTSLHAGSVTLANTMVPPMGTSSVPLPAGSAANITYQTINDFGALTPITKGIFQ